MTFAKLNATQAATKQARGLVVAALPGISSRRAIGEMRATDSCRAKRPCSAVRSKHVPDSETVRLLGYQPLQKRVWSTRLRYALANHESDCPNGGPSRRDFT
jgi:hypothetical protein